MPYKKTLPTYPPCKNIGLQIKELRLQRRFTVAYVSAKLHINTTKLLRIENGYQCIDIPTLLSLAAFYQVTPASILDLTATRILAERLA